jgi:hypothetical protein
MMEWKLLPFLSFGMRSSTFPPVSPCSSATAVALDEPARAFLVKGRAETGDLHLHQCARRRADHPAIDPRRGLLYLSIGAFRFIVSLVIDQFSKSSWFSQLDLTGESSMTTAKLCLGRDLGLREESELVSRCAGGIRHAVVTHRETNRTERRRVYRAVATV